MRRATAPLRGDYAQAGKQVWKYLAADEIRDVRLYHAMVR
jgi:hypothetical protein